AQTPLHAFPSGSQEMFAKTMVTFEENRGQVHRAVRFFSQGIGYSVFLCPNEVVLSWSAPTAPDSQTYTEAPSHHAVRIEFIGANSKAEGIGSREVSTRSNYFFGNDPNRWLIGVPHFSEIKFHEVYPGIDIIYRITPEGLEYDFVLAPGGDPR